MLNDNQLTGEVPAALVSLVNLWQLQLASNQLDCMPRALRKVWTTRPLRPQVAIRSATSPKDRVACRS